MDKDEMFKVIENCIKENTTEEQLSDEQCVQLALQIMAAILGEDV